MPNLRGKKKYTLHYHNLKLYIELGMVLTAIHRVIKFKQSAWLKGYIDFNTEKRRQATLAKDDVGKDLYKFMNNSVFGKTMENVRKRRDIELVTNEKVAQKRIAKPNYVRAKRFHDGLVAVHMQKTKLLLNRPIQVGFAILEISKVHMYRFHYQVWLPKFPTSTLLFTDTDSLCYAVKCDDAAATLRAGMAELEDEFDFSDYPTTHPLYSAKNMKVNGKFKDELKSCAMTKFVGLRPKLYSFVADPGSGGAVWEKNTAKGVKERVKNTKLSFADYERALTSLRPQSVSMNMIRSDHHKVYSMRVRKIGLSAYDDKRHICADGISTLAHGHADTRN